MSERVMRSGAFGRAGSGLLLVCAAAIAGGCGSDATYLEYAAPVGLGTLSLPLDTLGSSGALYRLSASLELRGPERKEVLLSGPVSVVETQVIAGSYAATLLDPWRLSRIEEDGPRAVDAKLISPNPSFVEIVAGQKSRLFLQFRVGDEVVPSPDQGALEVIVGVDDGPPPGGGCSDTGGALCFDQLLERHLQSLAGAFACLPSRQFDTPFGSVQVCSDTMCNDGTPGCSLESLDFDLTSEVAANGAVEIAASASFVRPNVIPIRLPSLFGGGICTLAVDADFPSVVASLGTLDVGNRQVSLAVTGVSVGLPDVDASLISGSSVCASVLAIAAEQLPAELQRLARQRLEAELARTVQSLVCNQCTAGCPLRCSVTQ